MRVTQLINTAGNPAANQFVITEDDGTEVFQSYKTTIARVKNGFVILDSKALNYSNTTSKHLFIFLGMTRKKIEKGIKDLKIGVTDLNQ